MFEDKNLIILGGTGSFGQAFLEYVFKNEIPFKNITLYSRDELKHYNLQQKYNPSEFPNLKFMIGDIRDKERLAESLQNQDLLINAAAMKHVYLCEQNPSECEKTNIGGTVNLLELLKNFPSLNQVIFISSDKAVNPVNVYGRSKKKAEELYKKANESNNAKISILRYGNVYGASGSLVPTIQKQKATGSIKITDPEMQRYFIQPDEAVEAVLHLLKNQKGGEILIPKSEKVKIIDLAKQIAPDARIEIIGKREGEKLDEELLTQEEMALAKENENYYIIE